LARREEGLVREPRGEEGLVRRESRGEEEHLINIRWLSINTNEDYSPKIPRIFTQLNEVLVKPDLCKIGNHCGNSPFLFFTYTAYTWQINSPRSQKGHISDKQPGEPFSVPFATKQ
jgi:hypothetical protein